MSELDQKIADLKEEIKGYVIKLSAATTEKELDRFTGLINSRTETLNRLLDEKKAQISAIEVKTSTLLVKIFIEDTVQNSLITFSSLKRPLDTMKEEMALQGLMKRGMSLDPYKLVTTSNVGVPDFASIQWLRLLIFHNPEKIDPLSGHEGSDIQLDQLKIVFEDVDLVEFFRNAGLSQFQMSARGAEPIERLSEIDESLHRKFIAVEVDGDPIASTRAIRESPLLQHPICRALFAARKYVLQKAFMDFVTHLLDAMGCKEGSLYAAPQMRINVSYGDTDKMAAADVSIIDLLSYARIGVVEEKNWEEMIPQLSWRQKGLQLHSTTRSLEDRSVILMAILNLLERM